MSGQEEAHNGQGAVPEEGAVSQNGKPPVEVNVAIPETMSQESVPDAASEDEVTEELVVEDPDVLVSERNHWW